MFLHLVSRHGLAKCAGEPPGDEQSRVKKAAKLRSMDAGLDSVAGESSLEMMTLTAL